MSISISLSEDGDRVVAVFDDSENQTCIWDLQSAIELGTSVAHRSAIIPSAEFPNAAGGIVPDGTIVLVAGTDGVIHAWSVADAAQIARFEGHTAAIADLAVTSDRSQIVSGGVDRSVRTWKFPAECAGVRRENPDGCSCGHIEVG